MPSGRPEFLPAPLRRAFLCLIVVLVAVVPSSLPTAAAGQGRHGLQGGWAVDDIGHVNFVHSLSLQFGFMQQAGAGWVRINFRLGKCFADWTTPSDICPDADAETALGIYDDVINKAHASNLQVLGLLSNESMRGDQTDWLSGNTERQGGNGDNAYIRRYARDVAGVLARHFANRVTAWEIWNEPNAWTENAAPGVFSGGSFMYPSNFAWLLKRSHAAIKAEQPNTSSTVVSGGLFGLDGEGSPAVAGIKGASLVSGRDITCATNVSSGADYLCLTYAAGVNSAGWTPGVYPLDAIGQHLYVDQAEATSVAKITTYVDDVRHAYLNYEGVNTHKPILVTEIGWFANPSDTDFSTTQARQASNLKIAYETFSGIPYVSRAFWFNVQDVPEANLFAGQVDGGDDYSLGTPKYPVFSMFQRYSRT
jgi:Glycosyl hydrolase catalytic core